MGLLFKTTADVLGEMSYDEYEEHLYTCAITRWLEEKWVADLQRGEYAPD